MNLIKLKRPIIWNGVILSEASPMHQELEGEPFQVILCYNSTRNILSRNTIKGLGRQKDPCDIFSAAITYTQHPTFRDMMHAVQKKYVRISTGHHGDPKHIAVDRRPILMVVYSGMFIGGSRLSTRVRRSKSLPSNFFMKG